MGGAGAEEPVAMATPAVYQRDRLFTTRGGGGGGGVLGLANGAILIGPIAHVPRPEDGLTVSRA